MKKEELRVLRSSVIDPETQKEKAKQETLVSNSFTLNIP